MTFDYNTFSGAIEKDVKMLENSIGRVDPKNEIVQGYIESLDNKVQSAKKGPFGSLAELEKAIGDLKTKAKSATGFSKQDLDKVRSCMAAVIPKTDAEKKHAAAHSEQALREINRLFQTKPLPVDRIVNLQQKVYFDSSLLRDTALKAKEYQLFKTLSRYCEPGKYEQELLKLAKINFACFKDAVDDVLKNGGDLLPLFGMAFKVNEEDVKGTEADVKGGAAGDVVKQRQDYLLQRTPAGKLGYYIAILKVFYPKNAAVQKVANGVEYEIKEGHVEAKEAYVYGLYQAYNYSGMYREAIELLYSKNVLPEMLKNREVMLKDLLIQIGKRAYMPEKIPAKLSSRSLIMTSKSFAHEFVPLDLLIYSLKMVGRISDPKERLEILKTLISNEDPSADILLALLMINNLQKTQLTKEIMQFLKERVDAVLQNPNPDLLEEMGHIFFQLGEAKKQQLIPRDLVDAVEMAHKTYLEAIAKANPKKEIDAKEAASLAAALKEIDTIAQNPKKITGKNHQRILQLLWDVGVKSGSKTEALKENYKNVRAVLNDQLPEVTIRFGEAAADTRKLKVSAVLQLLDPLFT